MKKITLLFFVLGTFTISGIIACGGEEKKQVVPAEVAKEQYQCPMKCTEEIYDKPGQCSVCGMELEKITKS